MRCKWINILLLLCGLGVSWAAPVPVEVPNGDFAEDVASGIPEGWTVEGLPASMANLRGEGGPSGAFFSPLLPVGRRCVLTSTRAIPVTPYHCYRLEMQVCGVPYLGWTLNVLQMRRGQSDTAVQLWPTVYGSLPPAPAWRPWRHQYIASGDVTGIKLQFIFVANGSPGRYRCGLDSISLLDLGALAPVTPPAANLRFNPGFELFLPDGKTPVSKPEIGMVVLNPQQACSGNAYLHVETNKRIFLSLADATVTAPSLYHLSLWARGSGKFTLRARQYGAPPERMQDQTSCEYLLTGRWQRYEIDLPVIEQSPPIAGVSALC
ncbi:MAG TPA: hypothetical protein VGM23_08020, partial [Armatimonadota bacterium]